MLDTDIFLTVLYVMADDFCKRQPQRRRAPGPKASLTESEVITLVIFSQWARFRSERDFYRYTASRLRPAFPTLPRRCQFNRLTRRCYGTLAAFFRCLAEDFFAFRHTPHPRLPSLGAPALGWYVADKGFEGREWHKRWQDV